MPRMIADVCALLLFAVALSGCAGLHLHRPEHATLAQEAKKTFTEKVDLLALVATERANLAKQKEAELAAIDLSQKVERDLVFFNAARLGEADRFVVLRLPTDEAGCTKPLNLRYVGRRLCELKAETPDKLKALINAEGDVYRSKVRREYVAENRKDLQGLGWKEPPECKGVSNDDKVELGTVAQSLLDAAPEDSIKNEDKQTAESLLRLTVRHCRALNAAEANLRAADGLKPERQRLEDLQREQMHVADEAKNLEVQLKALADELKPAAGARPDETRKRIATEAAKLRELAEKGQSAAKRLGAQEALADLRINAVTTLLQALEGKTIPEDRMKDEGMRQAVVAAQTLPQLLDEMKTVQGLLIAPARSSLLIAQRQALIDKENVAARKALLDKRVELVRQRISRIVAEARLLQRASARTDPAACEKVVKDWTGLPDDEVRIALHECGSDSGSRLLLGFNDLSRAILVERAAQERTRWEEVYLSHEQIIAANEYALKSWNNLIGTPIGLIEGYHAGGLKPEALGDLIFKAGSLGLLGIAVNKAD